MEPDPSVVVIAPVPAAVGATVAEVVYPVHCGQDSPGFAAATMAEGRYVGIGRGQGVVAAVAVRHAGL